MRGAIPPLRQYAFMGWCSVKAQGQLYLYLQFYLTPAGKMYRKLEKKERRKETEKDGRTRTEMKERKRAINTKILSLYIF
jgi:hypothetical protein